MTRAQPENNSEQISRPGVSQKFLREQKIVRVSNEQAQELLGFPCRHDCSGIWVPYHSPFVAGPLMVQGRAFGRLRLDVATKGTKYLSPKNSGSPLYVPLNGGPFGKELVICEGEFKTNALCEAGVRAVGIGGISSAMSDHKMIPDLSKLLAKWPLEVLYFLGDSDTALNFAFSYEAAKLRKALSETCKLALPRIPLAMPKGIDDCREQEGEGFMIFWEKIVAAAIQVGPKPDPSHLSLRLLESEWEIIAKDKDLYLPQLITLGSDLISETSLDELARRVKACWDINISAFKSDATKQKHGNASEPNLSLPTLYFDGGGYYRPNKDTFERISREDTMLGLRADGYWHRMANGCELTPCEVVLHRIQTEQRIDYAGPICGRPPGLWEEGGVRILCTKGPMIITAKKGDAAPMEQFLGSLLGRGRDPFFEQQFTAFAGWILHAREAVRNHQQHLPGQVLGLIGPRDCGKSLCQGCITLFLGGREADASLWLVRGNDFNSDLWGAEHLRLGDEELSEDHRERHGLRERLKKVATADVYPLHAKYRDAKSFRPIWRATLSANDDSRSIALLPLPTDSFADKIIYLRCYKPATPYHDGSAQASKAFYRRLIESLPAFLHKLESIEFPAAFRDSRFFIKEFHHPYITSLVEKNSSIGPISELLLRFLSDHDGKFSGTATEIYEALKSWCGDGRGLLDYSKSAIHFAHQLYELSELPSWNQLLTRSTRRVGGRLKNQEQIIWSFCLNQTE